MTRNDIERMVAVWKERLYLTHWQTTIAWEKPLENEGVMAECDRWDSYDYATLRFAPDWPTWEQRQANTTVVHELLHMTTRDLEYAAATAEKLVPKAVYALFDDRYKYEEEGVIDRLATILVDLGGEVPVSPQPDALRLCAPPLPSPSDGPQIVIQRG